MDKNLLLSRTIINWFKRILNPNKLKLYRVNVINQSHTGLVWHEIMASNEKEALLMANYISYEGWEA